MKKLTWFASGLAALALSSGVAFAGMAEPTATEKKVKELEQAIEDQGIFVETSQKGIVLSGYVDTSYTYNFNGGGTSEGRGNTPGVVNGGMGGGVAGGADSQDFNLNAVKLALEKALPEENKLAAGFRVDLLMGEDWGTADVNGLTIQQAYATFRAPIGNGLDVKVGQMVGLLGLEVDERPANMNFSYGTTYAFGLPTGSEAGVNFKYKVNDNVTAQVRLANVDGVDSDFYDESDFSKAVSALVSLTNSKGNASLNVGFWYTPDGAFAAGQPLDTATADFSPENDDMWVFNINGLWKPVQFEDKLTLGFDSVLGLVDDNYRATEVVGGETKLARGGGVNTDQYWGLELFAKYQFSKMFSLAGRGSYFHDDDGTAKLRDDALLASTYDRVPFGVTSTDLWSYTLTAGFDIWENLVTRLEYRIDVLSSNGDQGLEENAFSNGQSNQHTVGVNVAYQF